VSRCPALALIDDFVLLFLPPCDPQLTPLATGPQTLWSSISPLMSALTTHTSSQFREKRKIEEMKEELKQVIKSQTKAKKRSLEREKISIP
jgi:hypothetical protein